MYRERSGSSAVAPAVVAEPARERTEFTALLRRHDPQLRGLAYKLLGGDRGAMDDALQEAYLQAFRARDSLRSVDEAGSWLYRIVYNACIDELRRSRRRPSPVDTDDVAWERPARGPAPDHVVITSDTVRRALASLPDDQRVTLVLVDGEGYDHASAAELLGVAPGTVASRLSRARQALRTAIGEDDR